MELTGYIYLSAWGKTHVMLETFSKQFVIIFLSFFKKSYYKRSVLSDGNDYSFFVALEDLIHIDSVFTIS